MKGGMLWSWPWKEDFFFSFPVGYREVIGWQRFQPECNSPQNAISKGLLIRIRRITEQEFLLETPKLWLLEKEWKLCLFSSSGDGDATLDGILGFAWVLTRPEMGWTGNSLGPLIHDFIPAVRPSSRHSCLCWLRVLTRPSKDYVMLLSCSAREFPCTLLTSVSANAAFTVCRCEHNFILWRRNEPVCIREN